MNIDKLTRIITPSLMRYIVVGFASLTADYFIFIVFYYALHLGTAIAAPTGLVVGLVINFTLNKLWSFKNYEVNNRTLARQLLFYMLLVIVNSIFTYYFIEIFKISSILEPKISKLIATAIITLWNYALYNKLIFKLED